MNFICNSNFVLFFLPSPSYTKKPVSIEMTSEKLGEAFVAPTQAEASSVVENIGADQVSIAQELQGEKNELLSMTSDAKDQGLSHLSNMEEINAKVQNLMEQNEKLINKVNMLQDKKEKSKEAVEHITSVLREVSLEAKTAKDNILSAEAKLKNLETQLDDLKLCLKEAGEKNEIMETKIRDEKWKMSNMSNPIVFLDISIGGVPAGRIFIELYADVTPRAAENFRALCSGEKGIGEMGMPLHYKGSNFGYISPGEFCQGGNIPPGDRFHGESIYGEKFAIENFIKKHTLGALSMASNKANGSEFFICHSKLEKYDHNYCVFGQVVEGVDVLGAIDKVGSSTWKPSKDVKIVHCGQLC